MSAKGPWTGGLANREYRRGTRAEPPPVDAQAILAQVRSYLADCALFKALLRAADHPTEEGALKIVYCRTERHREVARAAFRHLTAGRAR